MLELKNLLKIKKAAEKFKKVVKENDPLGAYTIDCFLNKETIRILNEDILAVKLLKKYPHLDDEARINMAKIILSEKKWTFYFY